MAVYNSLRKYLFTLIIVFINTGNVFASKIKSNLYDPRYIVIPIVTIIITFAALLFSLYLIRKVFRDFNLGNLAKNQDARSLDDISKHTNRAGLNLILRAIYLFVVLKLWSIISSTITYLYFAIFYKDYYAKDAQKFVDSLLYSHFSLKFINILPELGKWLIFIVIGFPLLRDLHQYLKIDYKSLLFYRKKQ